MKKSRQWSVPLSSLICIWLFLFLWIPPFSMVIFSALSVLEGLTGLTSILKLFDSLTLEYAPPFLYAALAGGLILNLVNSIRLLNRQKFDTIQELMIMIRGLSIITYPALLWGTLCSILFLMGPDRNVHIFLLILLSLPALNLLGLFYAVPLILQLKKEHKTGLPGTVFYLIFSCIIGFDIVTAFLIQKKRK